MIKDTLYTPLHATVYAPLAYFDYRYTFATRQHLKQDFTFLSFMILFSDFNFLQTKTYGLEGEHRE